MKKTDRLSEAELEIMHVLWRESTPLKASEIVKILSDKYSWKVPTAHVMLSRLVEKGYIGVDKSAYSHKFFAIVSEAEHLACESALLVKKAGGKLPLMFASLIESDDVTDEELFELSAMLDKRISEIKKGK